MDGVFTRYFCFFAVFFPVTYTNVAQKLSIQDTWHVEQAQRKKVVQHTTLLSGEDAYGELRQ